MPWQGSAFVLRVIRVSTVTKAVTTGGLERAASVGATAEELPVTQPPGSASAHLGRPETNATSDAGQTSTAPTALCDASVPANPSAIPTTGSACAQPHGWGQPAKKVALQSLLFMKNKLKKEGVFFQELYNSNIWTNKWTVLYAQTVFEFGYENSYSIQLELCWSIHTSYGRLQRPFSSWILLKSWICFMYLFLASYPTINLLGTLVLIYTIIHCLKAWTCF